MDKRVLLCIDSDAKSMASSAGCGRDTRECPSCVLVESRAEQCRARARLSPDIDEVWVVSCDDMDAINVAAAIKRDDPGKRVHLVADEQNGSLASRAANAEIDELWSCAMLESATSPSLHRMLFTIASTRSDLKRSSVMCRNRSIAGRFRRGRLPVVR